VLKAGRADREAFRALPALDGEAGSLVARGRYRQAQPLFEKALAIYRKVLGEGHPHTATSYNNLAYTLKAQGKYAAAQPLLEKALAIDRKALGEDHPSTASSYNNLAANLDAQGKYAEAQPLYEKVLAICRKVLGEHHPYTATSYNNLASNLDDQGKYAAARPLYQKALAIRLEALGEHHPDTASSYHNLASNLDAQGDYAGAEGQWTRAADAFALARLRAAPAGFDRASFSKGRFSPVALPAALARNGKPLAAWGRLEQALAQGTREELAARLRWPPEDQARLARLRRRLDRLDRLLEGTLSAEGDTPGRKRKAGGPAERAPEGRRRAGRLPPAVGGAPRGPRRPGRRPGQHPEGPARRLRPAGLGRPGG
jgi:tetratricopeptide (TPR) repeat protein